MAALFFLPLWGLWYAVSVHNNATHRHRQVNNNWKSLSWCRRRQETLPAGPIPRPSSLPSTKPSTVDLERQLRRAVQSVVNRGLLESGTIHSAQREFGRPNQSAVYRDSRRPYILCCVRFEEYIASRIVARQTVAVVLFFTKIKKSGENLDRQLKNETGRVLLHRFLLLAVMFTKHVLGCHCQQVHDC